MNGLILMKIVIYIYTYDKLGYWSCKDTVNMDTENVTVDMIHEKFGKYNKNIKHIVIESEN